MLKTCKCGKDFLTEADAYVVIPLENYELNCGCYFETEELYMLKAYKKKGELKNKKYEGIIEIFRACVEFYANKKNWIPSDDYMGSRITSIDSKGWCEHGGQKARETIKKVDEL